MGENMSSFKKDFLDNYLKFGLGSMPKSDIDALVMHLIDMYGTDEIEPLLTFSNQQVSERLKTPVSKVKRMRYDAALKFGGAVEVQAKGRLLAALSNASIEPNGKKVRIIIEDTLAKNWLQGQLKLKQQPFENSFNTEIVEVNVDGFFAVLESVFGPEQLVTFKEEYKDIQQKLDSEQRVDAFKSLAKNFAEGAAKAAGTGVVTVFKAHFGI
jgi:hypothetical protein